MTESLRSLLTGAIDYAGLFPPAALNLAEAVHNHRRYRASAQSWLLGRFVIPAARLGELAPLYRADTDGLLTAIAAAGETAEACLEHVDRTLALVNNFPAARAIDTWELCWPAALLEKPDRAQFGQLLEDIAARLAASKLRPGTLFFELPAPVAPRTDAAGPSAPGECAAALAAYNRTASAGHSLAGLKVRTGGTSAAAIPSREQLAAVIAACRDAGVCWKATAGLHHAVRHNDRALGATVHGFLNVFAATVLADARDLAVDRIQAILADEDASHFRCDGDMLAWCELFATATEIATARERSLRSFGSCSFDEPCDDLRSLGLL